MILPYCLACPEAYIAGISMAAGNCLSHAAALHALLGSVTGGDAMTVHIRAASAGLCQACTERRQSCTALGHSC